MKKGKNKVLKFLVVLLIIVLDVVIVGVVSKKSTEVQSDDTTTVSLYDRGLTVVQEMNTLINDENYLKMIGITEELESTIINLSEMDYENPLAVYRVTNLKDIENLTMYMNEVDENSYDKEAREYAYDRLVGNLGNTIMSARTGTLVLAASSLIEKTDLFVDTMLTEPELYIYIYEGAYPVFVSYIPGENGAVSATGKYIVVDALMGADKDTVERTLDIYTTRFEVEEVTQ